MTFYLYILRCVDNTLYIGQTDNLEKRLQEHTDGKFHGYTSSRLPVVIVFSKTFSTRADVLSAEKRIKKWSFAKKIALVSGEIILS